MKKLLHRKLLKAISFMMIIALVSLSNLKASVELIKGGNMEDPSAWNVYWNTFDAKDTGTYEFNYTADVPTAGHGGCYRVTAAGQAANMLWQKVKIIPGHRYKISGAYKYFADTAINVWVELFITRIKPIGRNDTVSGEIATAMGYGMNTWAKPNNVNFDGTFQDDFTLANVSSVEFQIPDTVTQTEWYLAFKAGCWNGLGDVTPVYDLGIDDISLLDVTPGAELIKGGNMEDASAWNAYWNIFDAKDTGTYEFNYTTKTPSAGKGGCYRVTAAGQAANMLWQPVTIIPGHKYELTGAYKYLADTAVNVWVELFITRIKPKGASTTESGEIATAMGYGMNTWAKPNNVNLDGTFQDDFTLANISSVEFQIPDTVTQTEWYVAFKAGCWNGLGDVTPVYDLCIDEISLRDMNIINSGSNMEDPSAWNVYWNTFDAKDTGTYEFNYTAQVPTAGKGGCYRVTAAGQAANMLWQPVTIIPGHNYSLEGAYRYIADTAVNVWVEYFLTRIKPVGRNDTVSGEIATGIGYGMNTWAAPDNVNLDGTFQDNFTLANTPTKTIMIPDTVTQTEWYLALKAGCWNGLGDVTPVYDVLFDELTLTDLGPGATRLPIENVVFGTVDNAADYTGSVSVSWDLDSLYMTYDITDDSIVNSGASYQVDNIEIYLDMTNSKNIHYPRNGGWVKAIDDAFDATDYQLRLVPDVAFITNNTARPASASIPDTVVDQIYTRTDNGYKFVLNVAWEALKTGFVPEVGTEIGFDVLVSDNDAVASDANRNQITWNSPTANPFNDPSIWGVLQFRNHGTFMAVPDKQAPILPASVVATVDADTNVIITWDAASDNRVVQNYAVYQGNTLVTTILAKATGNTYTVKGLENGTYTFGIIAIDMYNNKSAKAVSNEVTIDYNPENVPQNGITTYKLYPNPATESIILTGIQSANAMVYIYDAVGQLVLSGNVSNASAFNVSKLKSGVYMVKVQDNNHVFTTKMIKK